MGTALSKIADVHGAVTGSHRVALVISPERLNERRIGRSDFVGDRAQAMVVGLAH